MGGRRSGDALCSEILHLLSAFISNGSEHGVQTDMCWEHNYDIFIQYVNESQDNFMNISVLKLLYRFKTKFDNLRCGNKTQRR